MEELRNNNVYNLLSFNCHIPLYKIIIQELSDICKNKLVKVYVTDFLPGMSKLYNSKNFAQEINNINSNCSKTLPITSKNVYFPSVRFLPILRNNLCMLKLIISYTYIGTVILSILSRYRYRYLILPNVNVNVAQNERGCYSA